MWIFYAFLSSFLAGITAILAKCGIKNTDSNVATALRTIVVLVFSWIMVFVVGSQDEIQSIDAKTWIFLILSGLATGASWLCYFRALSIGNINKVVPVDKSSVIFTMILAFLVLGEEISIVKFIAMILLGVGTYMMIERKDSDVKSAGKGWFVYALLSAIFASLTTILGKIGIAGVESNLGTALRTGVVLIMAWLVVVVSGKMHTVRQIKKRELGFIVLSGIATGGSWLCYYKALKDGLASVVVPIDKLSVVVTIAFSYIVFHEKLSKKAAIGLAAVILATFMMIL